MGLLLFDECVEPITGNRVEGGIRSGGVEIDVDLVMGNKCISGIVALERGNSAGNYGGGETGAIDAPLRNAIVVVVETHQQDTDEKKTVGMQ